MSNAPKKKEETQVSGIFSIGPNPFDEGAIPGVTQLLSRKKMEEEALRIKNLDVTRTNLKRPTPPREEVPSANTKTNLVMPSMLKLRDLGVLFELRFHPEGSVFRYSSSQGHKEARLLPWQEQIFLKMKMDKQSIPAKEPFQEFRADEQVFLFDAFGIQTQHTIQIVSPEYTNTRIVLVSEKSIAEHEAAIVDHFSKG